MIYDERSAPTGLGDAITRMWFLDTPRPRRYEKILPMPFAHLIVNLSDPYRIFDGNGSGSVVPDVFVSGLQSRFLVIESPIRIRHLGIEFTPTGLARFGITLDSANEGGVQDATTAIDGIRHLVSSAKTSDAPHARLDDLDRLLRNHPHHSTDPTAGAMLTLIAADPERPVGEIAAALGISPRTLVNRFRRTTGTTPKRHVQVVRFHRLIDAIHAAGGSPQWATLAVTAGYYDQPHVIRDFRRFSGWTPTEYCRVVAQHGPDAAHFVPLDQVPAQASS